MSSPFAAKASFSDPSQVNKRLHIVVRGRVQGVNFRWATQREARSQNLTGWVRNNEDGSVEIVAEGAEDALARFREWCKKGPPAARVTSCEVHEENHAGVFPSFDVRYD